MCTDISIDMCIDMCMDLYIDMCIDMCMDMCTPTRFNATDDRAKVDRVKVTSLDLILPQVCGRRTA